MEPLDIDKWVVEGVLVKESLLKEVEVCCGALRSKEGSEQLAGSARFYDFITTVWALDTRVAMDAAETVCNHIRESGCLDVMLCLMATADEALLLQVCKGIEQIMTSIVLESSRFATGILENLFKHSAETCVYLIGNKALDGVLKGCRSMDVTVLQHCAAALANCAMYGGPKCQVVMIAHQVDLWLFPLAFSQNDVVKYYALLAIVFLASNPDLQMTVERSGTLALVVPYLQSQDPEELPRKCHNHAHGRSASWLKRLVSLLLCDNEQARLLSAFHFAMETSVKKKQQRLQVFHDIGAIQPLFQSVRESSRMTSELCCRALHVCDVAVPTYQYWNVLNWDSGTVSEWVLDVGLANQSSNFRTQCVTGTLLLELTVEDMAALGLSKLQSRWFLQQALKLRCVADVANRDYYNMCHWLKGVSRELIRYKVNFVIHAVSSALLPHLTDDILQELGVHSSLDRLKLLLASKQLSLQESTDSPAITSQPHYDVFISYRRANGSQLASLLKVHLELRGLKVFIDIKELGSGNFCEAILSNITRSSSVIVVLSPDALDRCKDDDNNEDWLHRELDHALRHEVLVIPLMDPHFQWPKDTDLPEDIRHICTLNGVSWSHDYQDACVSKVISFLPQSITQNKLKRNPPHTDC